MQNIADILNTFDPISLGELQANMLMRRFDTKYKFNISRLPEFLNAVSKDYYVLDIKDVRLHRYESLYFDTDNFRLFIQHQNIRRNRFKVRYRRYTDSNLVFFEIKQKNNKNFTIKERIQQKTLETSIQHEAAEFLKEMIKMPPELFLPKIWVYYYRMTLVNKHAEERLTIDVDLSFASNDKHISCTPLIIAEVKQGHHFRSPFTTLMKQHHIITEEISKYCMGVCLTHDNIKKNNFKKNFISINKIFNEKY